jgi:hypothetical protein
MKKIDFILVASIFMFMCVYSFAQESVGTSPHLGIIKGKVTDTQTPRASNLKDAEVVIESELFLAAEGGKRTVLTDSAGNYGITNLPPGEYAVTVLKKGYDSDANYVTVTPGGEAFHDVRLYKTNTILTFIPKMLLIVTVVGVIILLILQTWMLIDCATKEPSQGNDKIVWVIIIIFTGFIGALVYLIVRRPKRIAEIGR